jgi:hypothetical protein
MSRTADELMNVADPAWPHILARISTTGPGATVLPADAQAARREIELLQVTAHSTLGAFASSTGGVLLDHGWLRLLGCGHERCTWSISAATRALGLARADAPPAGIIVAIDVLGGIFTINGGFIEAASPGEMVYFGPDLLAWATLGLSHSAWLDAMLDTRRRNAFYGDLRWSGWEREVEALAPNEGLSFYPFLWTRESRPLERASRRPMPIDELVMFNLAADPGSDE